MSCFYPRDAWRSKNVNENGKRPIVFRRSEGFEDMALQIPCGKCDGCKADKALSWSIRCAQEASLFDRNCFITLTYDDAHVPADGKLVKKHLQDFFKRLRHMANIRYYACGEYGDKTKRPHYHACIFGQDFRAASNIEINSELYSDNALCDAWGHGSVVCADFTMAAACYVAGYVAKKIGSEDDDSFQIMSRRPGLGKEWLNRYWEDLLRLGYVVIEGRKYPVPHRYLQWMEVELADVKRQRGERFKNMDIERRIDMHRERRAREITRKQRVQHQKDKGSI